MLYDLFVALLLALILIGILLIGAIITDVIIPSNPELQRKFDEFIEWFIGE